MGILRVKGVESLRGYFDDKYAKFIEILYEKRRIIVASEVSIDEIERLMWVNDQKGGAIKSDFPRKRRAMTGT